MKRANGMKTHTAKKLKEISFPDKPEIMPTEEPEPHVWPPKVPEFPQRIRTSARPRQKFLRHTWGSHPTGEVVRGCRNRS